mmetsp:Transcript_98149/g.174718  ORF Transcript_98149/g.174718 Transcript_98149/m.174718 type:complete len:447 (+) Transcript_98149:68-1408(+)|eukprot:CAMPEP_0197622606 /NCGR_PEP_ID=MMETSP1338-20131121/2840_1 /TAXON_ID=43686 ORGANISM="Pelagodinium beii, Strain RCC1491" /NCGR_SAMPLE_ID=MMETSP1338 /ASSEMBLY_ACC=CAM_ASM_000754 /LENGTH=446 /DNA_ID=CAMNT_0043192349 /DNA_START=68 /DNA_END=1408 /DNA_ORIENTATION=+
MVNAVVFAIATGIGLLTDKYMLEATNFVEHYAIHLQPSSEQKEFIKSAMYAGAILGMISLGPISDVLGRRFCLITCSVITLVGCLLSTCAWDANVLIAARIITGIGMGGEYPLASSHSAESAENTSNGSRNVALLYLFGSGFGPILCDFVCYFMDAIGAAPSLIWRTIFGVGTFFALVGLILRVLTTENSHKFIKAAKSEKGATRSFLVAYWQPLLGTALIWCLFDIVEYGLKQNDAAIFSAAEGGPYKDSVLTVMATRCLVIPSLVFTPWLLSKVSSKQVQLLGFCGCFITNLCLAIGYNDLKHISLLFDTLYIVQLSFQSLPGVTTMALSAEIFPSAMRGTGAGISAASGKIGATFGSFFFTMLKEKHEINAIFWVVVCTSTLALVLTCLLTPFYNGATLDAADMIASSGQLKEAKKMLYSGPVEEKNDEINAENEGTGQAVAV